VYTYPPTTLVWGNRVLGYSQAGGDVLFTTSPPTLHYWPTWPVLQVSQQVGFFGAVPVGQQPGGGNLIASGQYTAQEQKMLNYCYAALRAYGLIP
jgi:hypothetical protein